jgi:hypothetical protein
MDECMREWLGRYYVTLRSWYITICSLIFGACNNKDYPTIKVNIYDI